MYWINARTQTKNKTKQKGGLPPECGRTGSLFLFARPQRRGDDGVPPYEGQEVRRKCPGEHQEHGKGKPTSLHGRTKRSSDKSNPKRHLIPLFSFAILHAGLVLLHPNLPCLSQLITADTDGFCKLWDLRTFACVETFTSSVAESRKAKSKSRNATCPPPTRVSKQHKDVQDV